MHRTGTSLNRLAFSATAHCLTGCAIGEVLGVVIGTALGWGDFATIALAIVLAFFFGYLLTMLPLLRSGLALGAVLPLAFASDTLSITVMEIVDNLVLLAIPGAMEAGVSSLLFWGSLAFALAVAFVAAFPVNRYLIVFRAAGIVNIFQHGPWFSLATRGRDEVGVGPRHLRWLLLLLLDRRLTPSEKEIASCWARQPCEIATEELMHLPSKPRVERGLRCSKLSDKLAQRPLGVFGFQENDRCPSTGRLRCKPHGLRKDAQTSPRFRVLFKARTR